MLISKKINDAFNTQIGHELANSNQYQAIANWFERESLLGFARIYNEQAVEERAHALKFMKFLVDAGGNPVVPAVAAVRNDFEKPLDAAQVALDAEMATTEQIYGLVKLARDEQNPIAENFLQWFVGEQLEEVASAEQRLHWIRKAGPSVLMVEAYLIHNKQ